MAAPPFVNSGTLATTNFASSLTPALPGSRTNGNLLLAVVNAPSGVGNYTFSTSTTGWFAVGTPVTTSAGCSALFGRIVDGTEAAPVITFSGATGAIARIFQYGAVFTGSSIGQTHRTKNSTATVTVTDAGVTVDRNNSRVVVIIIGHTGVTTISTPTGYTLDEAANVSAAFGTVAAFSQTTPNDVGESSTAVSATAGTASNSWIAWSVEIASEGAPINITAGNHGLGASMAATVTRERDIVASPALGISAAATVQNTITFSAAPALGLSESATITFQRNLVASPALGVSLLAAVDAIFTLPLTAVAVGASMAVAKLVAAEKPPQPTIIICS